MSVPGTRVVVVGGGMAGLAAAHTLVISGAGLQVTVLEGSDRVGGSLRQEAVAGHQVDVGAEAMLAVRPEGIDLVRGIGLGERLVAPATTAAQVWSRGRLWALPRASLMGIPGDPRAAAGILSDDEIGRALAEQDWPGGPLTEDVSVGEYVSTRLGQAVVDRLVEPLLGGVYAGHASRLSLEATMPAVYAAACAGDSLSGVAAAAATRAASVSPTEPPRPPFIGMSGGVGALPGDLTAYLTRRGAQVRTQAMVRGVERTEGGWCVVVGSAADPETVEADAVVIALPPAPAARLLAPHAPLAATDLAEIETASSAVVTLALPRAAVPALTGSGFLVPPVDGRAIKASTFSSSKWAWTGALAPELVFLRGSIGRAREEAQLQRSDGDLVDVVVREIGEAIGTALPVPVDAHVQRWGGAIPQYAVGHRARVQRVRARVAAVPGVSVCGAAYDGVGIPAVIASAQRAAHECLGYVTANRHHLDLRRSPAP